MDPLWTDLVNSDWHDHRGSGRREDRIGNDAWLARFLARAGWSARRLPGAVDRDRLRALRRLLRGVVDRLLSDQAVPARDLAALNRCLAAFPQVQRLEEREGGLSLTAAPVAGGIERVLGAVALSFADLLAHGDPSRIKVCANPDCRWVLYDASRNRTRRWCEGAVCGSLIKVRHFRSRRRARRALPPPLA
ncbi:MAG: CGNR zinc finger domain-containing protein [Acidobacteriota bacterium]